VIAGHGSAANAVVAVNIRKKMNDFMGLFRLADGGELAVDGSADFLFLG
jgi:hypothetical protein